MSTLNSTTNDTMISAETVVHVVTVVAVLEALEVAALAVAARVDHKYNESCVHTNFKS